MSRSAPHRCAALALSLAALVAPRAAWAETWYEAYASGLKALEEGDLATAEEKLEEAARRGPRPGRQVRAYGVRFIAFLPQYELAKVYARQGRHAETLEQIRSLEAEGVLKPSDPESQQLAVLRQAATDGLAAAAQRSQIAAAPPPPQVPTPMPTPVPTPTPTLAAAAERAPAPPSAAGRSSTAAATPAPERPRAEVERFLDVARSALASQRWPEARDALAAARGAGLDAAMATRLSRQIESGEWLAAARERIASQDWQRADVALRRAAQADPANATVKSLQKAVDAGLAQLSGSSLERAALRSFYQGRYEQAEQLLRRVAGVSPSARVHLYLGFARAALALVSGATDGPLVDAARADFDRARRLRPDVSVDRRYVSPSIIELLEQTAPPTVRNTGAAP